MRQLTLLPAICAAGLIFCAAPALGATVADLYSARVPNVARDELDSAFRAGLGQILVKVTGRRDVALDQSVQGAFANPSSLVQQYRIDGEGDLWVTFDRVALKRILDSIGQPIWGDDRPSTLVWMVIDSGAGRREILPAAPDIDGDENGFAPTRSDRASRTARAIRDTLLTSARQRGLPIVLPLVDSEDLSRVSASDLWAGFSDTIRQASSRYGADAVLIGRATARSSGTARVRWTLLSAGTSSSWTGSVAAGPERLADELAARLATSRSGSRQVLLRIDGVDSLDAYGRVTNYLQNLSLVESLAVASVTGNALVFELDVRGDAERLTSALALRNVLQPDSRFAGVQPAADIGSRMPDLYYRVGP